MASVKMEWETRLGRRFRVRDLYILSTVIKSGGMAKAARQLSMSQPSVSAAIANLESILGVRLLDRDTRGIEPTIYAEAILKRSVAIFDELKQTVNDVQFLADPAKGELKIGCPDTSAATVVPQMIERFSEKYPLAVLYVDTVPTFSDALPVLRSRQYDLVFARLYQPLTSVADDLNVERLSMILWSSLRESKTPGRVVAKSTWQTWSTSPGSWQALIPGFTRGSQRPFESVDLPCRRHA